MTSSVELFQGKEKPVIIVSTVRTGRQGIGFLDSPQVKYPITELTFLNRSCDFWVTALERALDQSSIVNDSHR